ncbi:hypothetical protein C8R45DRAFT_1087529 [Mycena sanguinolenta]|nr:hypothetical protein C8R45DRAFT_1087529 [Mycena sanguinolenta]
MSSTAPPCSSVFVPLRRTTSFLLPSPHGSPLPASSSLHARCPSPRIRFRNSMASSAFSLAVPTLVGSGLFTWLVFAIGANREPTLATDSFTTQRDATYTQVPASVLVMVHPRKEIPTVRISNSAAHRYESSSTSSSTSV